jgi:hypothetical protein
MVATIPTNPYVQIGGNNGLFNTTSSGLRQGTAYPDPSTRFRLRATLLAQSETIPMWGGVGVYLNVPGPTTPSTANPSYSLGEICGRAVSLTDPNKPLAGFSVFDEAYGMVTSPQSPVPLIGSGGQVNVYPLGSLARIAVACDPSIISLRGGPQGAQVSWDFTNQLLIPYLGTLAISSGTYNNTTGAVALTMTVAPTFSAGDSVTLASLGGTGAFASLNGTYTVQSISGSVVNLTAAAALGAATITSGNLTVGGAASQALNVKILDIVNTNCETVVYNSTANTASWNYSGSCAVIQI